MSNDEFQSRIKRLNTKTQDLPRSRTQPNGLDSFSWAGAFKGLVLSLVIGFAFANIQTISDMAPQSIKDGPTPGIFGAPVAYFHSLDHHHADLVRSYSHKRSDIRLGGYPSRLPNRAICPDFPAVARPFLTAPYFMVHTV